MLDAPLLFENGKARSQERPTGTELAEQVFVYVICTILWWLLYFYLAAVLNDPSGPYAQHGGEQLLYGKVDIFSDMSWISTYYVYSWDIGVTGFWIGHVPMMIKARRFIDRRVHTRILGSFWAWQWQQTIGILLIFYYKIHTTEGSAQARLCYALFCCNCAVGLASQLCWVYTSAIVAIKPESRAGIDVEKAGFGLGWRMMGLLGTVAFLGCTGYDLTTGPFTLGEPANLPQLS